MPRGGDFTVCIQCETVLRYTDELMLRKLTLKDQLDLQADPELGELIRRAKGVVPWVKKKGYHPLPGD